MSNMQNILTIDEWFEDSPSYTREVKSSLSEIAESYRMHKELLAEFLVDGPTDFEVAKEQYLSNGFNQTVLVGYSFGDSSHYTTYLLR
jgi:basic membrane lipoprotein Med (substrate-binding protein (PBP1-ABC) superfamily)